MSHDSLPSGQVISFRVSSEIKSQLEALSVVTGRSKSFLASEALENYLKIQAWQTHSIQSALKKANAQDATFYSHEEISKWLNTWGTEDEKDRQK